METLQYCWNKETGWDNAPNEQKLENADLLIVFGATDAHYFTEPLNDLKDVYPEIAMAGCSTAGEILSTSVLSDSLAVTVISFSHTEIKTSSVSIGDYLNCEEAARELSKNLDHKDLQHVLVFADGVEANGSELARGFNAALPQKVTISGGLAGDGSRFERAFTVLNGEVASESIIVVGFYGNKLSVRFSSESGWIPFGPKRLVTSSEGNKLLGLDGQPALDLYKKYLGKNADGLPATGLLFPINVEKRDRDYGLVRSLTGVDEANGGIDFAGDVPTGSYAQLMRAIPNDIIEGAESAAQHLVDDGYDSPDLVLIVSCYGRKHILNQLVEEETESVHEAFANSPMMTGFYSYGEIAPLRQGSRVALHNQTMTITTFTEAE